MTKKQLAFFFALAGAAVVFSSCCGAECRLKNQQADNQFVIHADMRAAYECACRLLEAEGYKIYLQQGNPDGGNIVIVTGYMSANDPVKNKFVGAAIKKAMRDRPKDDIDRVDLEKTVIFKRRWDDTGEKFSENELGMIVTMEYSAKNAKGDVLDGWMRENADPLRSDTAESLVELIRQYKGPDEKSGE
jgi:hypothetical protein